ncbi:tetratricopeptide repeat protein [Chitinophaga silvisoli]|uniref:Tetratricopeptide repeat protein n=1 Tax=Chitinophaga silvisoli TaxID=2291814 RepID=A0A3E1P970_9BACT|nr:tetratricopeptide repeat protein [Chitinophaga silvisoli]RFM36729.1 tetratricopeptide repeat protein [Chitinophaga silvisoli]
MRIFLLCLLLAVNSAFAQEADQSEQTTPEFPDSAFLKLKEVYSKSIEEKDHVTTGVSLQKMGNICYYLGNYPQALEYHLKADKIFREQNRKDLLAANLNDMGILYYYNRQSSIARKQYNEALLIYKQSGDGEGLAMTYGKIGHLYEKSAKYDSAFAYQRKALSQYSSLAKKQGMAKIFENIGSIYEDLSNFDSAYYYYSHAYELYEQDRENVASIEVLNNLGDIFRKTGRYNEALLRTRQALLLAEKTNDLYEKGAAYRDLGKTYALMQQKDSAYLYAELSRKATIDIYSLENNRQTAFLSVLFDINKKDAEIIGLEHTRDIHIIVTIATIIVIILLLVLGRVILSRQRLMHASQQKLMQTALENKELQEDKLKQELEIKGKELASNTLHMIQKNQLLEELKGKLELMARDDRRDQKKQIQQVLQQINVSFNHDEYWNEFRDVFEQIHQDFFANLRKKKEDLSYNDVRLAALIKLNMNSKDMATLLAISQDSLRVARYRLRKKLGLDEGESLSAFIHSL